MSIKPDDLKLLISKNRKMNIEELKANIDQWEEDIDWPNKLQNILIAKNELVLKYKERQEQIELLTKSLTSSSRAKRWISSLKAVIKQLLKFQK